MLRCHPCAAGFASACGVAHRACLPTMAPLTPSFSREREARAGSRPRAEVSGSTLSRGWRCAGTHAARCAGEGPPARRGRPQGHEQITPPAARDRPNHRRWPHTCRANGSQPRRQGCAPPAPRVPPMIAMPFSMPTAAGRLPVAVSLRPAAGLVPPARSAQGRPARGRPAQVRCVLARAAQARSAASPAAERAVCAAAAVLVAVATTAQAQAQAASAPPAARAAAHAAAPASAGVGR